MPSARNPAGHRRFAPAALARLDLIRTLRALDLLHRLATGTEAERLRLVEDFLDAVFTRRGGISQSLTPELPPQPTAAQLEAWLELATLTQDPDFRALLRKLAEQHELPATGLPRPDLAATVRDRVSPALAEGLDPASPSARPVAEAILAQHPDLPDLLARLSAAADPRRDRYLRLLATVNGWPEPEPLAPALDWAIRALRSTPDYARG
ncbi:hypothetical protein [Crossiella sp. NPDC003009]